jgi:hypothetical protein
VWATPGGELTAVRVTSTESSGGAVGGPPRWRAAAMARWRAASGVRAGRPRPWRVKALRSDGQVVPSSWAAACKLPSCSARAKALGLGPIGEEPAGLPTRHPAQHDDHAAPTDRQSRPRRWAMAAASTRPAAPSLASRLET